MASLGPLVSWPGCLLRHWRICAYAIVAANGAATLEALLAGVAAAALAADLVGYVAFYGRVGAMFFAVMTLTVTLILLQVMGSTAYRTAPPFTAATTV
ncbi:MAG: hypothetical protein ACREFP_00415 [Acetobacteraceae bacterium]